MYNETPGLVYSTVMHNKIETIRWILVIPSAVVGWYIALFIGLILYAAVDLFCLPEHMVSGSCQAPWHEPVFNGLVVYVSCLSTVFVLVLSVIVAPKKECL